MKRIIIGVATLALAAGISMAAAAQGSSAALDQLLRSYGLETLDPAERTSVTKLILALINSKSASDATLAISSKSYLSRQGYETCDMRVANVDGSQWLVVQAGLSPHATKDLPILFNAITFEKGKYFCKKALMGGVSQFIDAEGEVQSLLFAKWVSLR
jgi:hypothetical protein